MTNEQYNKEIKIIPALGRIKGEIRQQVDSVIKGELYQERPLLADRDTFDVVKEMPRPNRYGNYLVVVNGEKKDPSVFQTLDPSIIESISITRVPDAIKKYGDAGKN